MVINTDKPTTLPTTIKCHNCTSVFIINSVPPDYKGTTDKYLIHAITCPFCISCSADLEIIES